ncbi:MAG: type II toxin-antitoxin system RelE/ParE family toxin [Desulfovibrio sp.]|nr:MAG: type II toxin-antitoxin system RelE/ParE family toxin [Desulfovibrio sp.]
MKIIWTANAVAQFRSIRSYLFQHADEDVMLNESKRIWTATQRLKSFPHSGRPGRVPGTRELVIPPYVLPYEVFEGVIYILTVFHTSRAPFSRE